MSSGVYQIRNKLNGNCYIGSSINLRKRRRAHLNALHCGKHQNQHLQRAFDKYGEDAFSFEVLEHIVAENLILCEQYYLDTLSPEYNLLLKAGSPLGYRHTEESRRNMSEGQMGRESFWKGKHLSIEHRRKLSEANKGRHPSAEHRRNLSKALMGHEVTEKTRKKLRMVRKGRRLSAEWRRKISEGLKGRPVSKETRRKMSEAHSGERHYLYGKHPSEETRQKMSMAQKARRRREHITKNQGEQTDG